MTPASFPLTLYRGDTYAWTLTLWADAARTVPADLSNATPAAQIRDKAGGTLVASLACQVQLPNVILMSLEADESAKLERAGAWDLQLSYADGSVHTPLAGKVTVTIDVTSADGLPRGEAAIVPMRAVR